MSRLPPAWEEADLIFCAALHFPCCAPTSRWQQERKLYLKVDLLKDQELEMIVASD
jgi:hypothetical protein